MRFEVPGVVVIDYVVALCCDELLDNDARGVNATNFQARGGDLRPQSSVHGSHLPAAGLGLSAPPLIGDS